MAKMLYAVTNIKGSDVQVKAGDPVDAEKFTKDELKALYDNGAVEVRDVEEAQVTDGEPVPDTSVENPKAAIEENANEG